MIGLKSLAYFSYTGTWEFGECRVEYFHLFFPYAFIFILSGILFKYRNFIESLKKGWHTLLVPYFIINLIILAYTSILLILKGTFDVQMFLGKVVAVIVGLGYNVGYLSPVSAPTWFLISLFFYIY